MTLNTSRRGFLAGATASIGLLTLGFSSRGALAAASDASFTPFVKISADGQITAVLKHFEMGQGTTTGLTSLIAEELNADLADVAVEFAPSDPGRYANMQMGVQGTGGSTAIANSYVQYRTAGAAARDMLLDAAAAEWGVPAKDLSLDRGVISGAGKSAPLGAFVAAAAALPVPAAPKLKDAEAFRIIGNPESTRRDGAGKIDGSAKFAMDMQLDGQLVVVLLRAPRLGAKLVSFDASAAQGIKGFVDAKALPDGKGVAVYATKTWSALQARDLVTPEWDFSAAESRSQEDIRADLLAKVNGPSVHNATPGTELADVEALIATAAHVVQGEFFLPNLAHAPMEPMTCTIEPVGDGIVLHDGCQFPTITHGAVASVLGLELSKVAINTMYAGGSFGRRANLDSDYHVEAAMAFALTDRTAPVKLVWSREDDIKGGYYRPAFAHKVRVGLDDAGKIVAWDHRVAGQSIFKGTPFEAFIVKSGVDHASVEGAADTPYSIPGMALGLTDAEPSVSVLWWRSVGHSHTAYVMESMMDMAAAAVGQDPVAFRLAHLAEGTPNQLRLAGVLTLAAQMAKWDTPLQEGRARGVAIHQSFGSFVAEVVEVSGAVETGIRIEKVTCAVDCGTPINPDVIKAQIEGGAGFGIGAVMRNQITLEGGEVAQSNFYDYEPLRIGDIAAIEVHIVPSSEAPTGVGEPGVPPAGPALANAIAALGTRVTYLPMSENGVTFA